MKCILTCKCGDTPEFAKDAYSLLFPETETPTLISGDDEIMKFSTGFPQGSEAYSYIHGIAISKEKYAIFMEIDKDNNIVQAYNLITGHQIQ